MSQKKRGREARKDAMLNRSPEEEVVAAADRFGRLKWPMIWIGVAMLAGFAAFGTSTGNRVFQELERVLASRSGSLAPEVSVNKSVEMSPPPVGMLTVPSRVADEPDTGAVLSFRPRYRREGDVLIVETEVRGWTHDQVISMGNKQQLAFEDHIVELQFNNPSESQIVLSELRLSSQKTAPLDEVMIVAYEYRPNRIEFVNEGWADVEYLDAKGTLLLEEGATDPLLHPSLNVEKVIHQDGVFGIVDLREAVSAFPGQRPGLLYMAGELRYRRDGSEAKLPFGVWVSVSSTFGDGQLPSAHYEMQLPELSGQTTYCSIPFVVPPREAELLSVRLCGLRSMTVQGVLEVVDISGHVLLQNQMDITYRRPRSLHSAQIELPR